MNLDKKKYHFSSRKVFLPKWATKFVIDLAGQKCWSLRSNPIGPNHYKLDYIFNASKLFRRIVDVLFASVIAYLSNSKWEQIIQRTLAKLSAVNSALRLSGHFLGLLARLFQCQLNYFMAATEASPFYPPAIWLRRICAFRPFSRALPCWVPMRFAAASPPQFDSLDELLRTLDPEQLNTKKNIINIRG